VVAQGGGISGADSWLFPIGDSDMNLLPRNEHTLDRGFRISLGLALIAIVFVGPHTPWGWLGIVPLATGLMGSCPIYTLLGLTTCPVKSKTATQH
jgi:Protein of unknown function (DUF2892)